MHIQVQDRLLTLPEGTTVAEALRAAGCLDGALAAIDSGLVL